MKRYLITFTIAFVAIFNFSFAQVTWQILLELEVGSQPADITGSSDGLFIYCLGRDVNFNGEYEPELGDEPSSIWKLDGDFPDNVSSRKIYEFTDAYFNFPLRVSNRNNLTGQTEQEAYIPFGVKYDESFNIIDQGKIVHFSLTKEQVIDNEFLKPRGVVFEDDEFLITLQNDDNSNGWLNIFVKSMGMSEILEVGKNAQEFLLYQGYDSNGSGNLKEGIAVLCVGDFATGSNSELYLFGADRENLEIWLDKVIPVGNTANHLSSSDYARGLISVTANTSHEVYLIDPFELEVVNTIKLPTEGFDGPRNSVVISPNLLATTAYNGKIYFHDVYNGDLIETIEVKGSKPEFIDGSRNVFFCSLINKIDYSPDNKVLFWTKNGTSVKKLSKFEASISLYPNPVSEFVNIDFSGGNVPLNLSAKLISLDGAIVSNLNLTITNTGYQAKLDINDPSQSIYYLILESETSKEAIPLRLVK